jgi:hypothetical protein
MFSAMMRMRPACARMPLAATAIDLRKSIMRGSLRRLGDRRRYALPTAVLISERLWL